MGMNTVLHGKDTSGNPEHVKITSGAAHFRPLPGPQTQARNRELLGVNAAADITAVVAGDLHTATWTDAENVTEITIDVCLGAALASTDTIDPYLEFIYVVFNAPSSAVAAGWLSELNSPASDTQRYKVYLGKPRIFRFTENITRLDCCRGHLGAGTNDYDVIIEAN